MKTFSYCCAAICVLLGVVWLIYVLCDADPPEWISFAILVFGGLAAISQTAAGPCNC